MKYNYDEKFGCKYVSNFEIYDTDNQLITMINTVQSDEIQLTKHGKYFLRIKDALIDKKFLDYISKHPVFEGNIKAFNEYRDLNQNDSKIEIDMPSVKLSNYKLRNVCDEVSTVNMLFELFVNDEKEYAFAVKLVD